MNLLNILIILGSYLLGAIPSGLLISMGSGIDIRAQGSKNIGATNVTRLMGKKLGIMTLAADIAKGFLPIFIAQLLIAPGPQKILVVALSGAAAVIGHMYPVYLKFKGGKGVATGLGVFLFLSPLAVLMSLGVFIAAVWLSGFVSLGSLLASAAISLWLWLLGEPEWKLWLAGFIIFFIWLKHYQNIHRLLLGQEKSWKKKP